MARLPAEITIKRPFFPDVSKKDVKRAELVAGLGVSVFDDLLRVCERRTAHRKDACSLFWTLGGNQVSKATIAGWREVVQPAALRGAALWPFDGGLAELVPNAAVVVGEMYPAEAYRMVGAGFLSGQSKPRQSDRRGKAVAVLGWASHCGVAFNTAAMAGLLDGFGTTESGEDPFDALMGLLEGATNTLIYGLSGDDAD